MFSFILSTDFRQKIKENEPLLRDSEEKPLHPASNNEGNTFIFLLKCRFLLLNNSLIAQVPFRYVHKTAGLKNFLY